MQVTFIPKVPHDPCPNAGGLHAPDVGQHLAANPHRQVQPDHLLCSHLCTCSTVAGLPLATSQHDQPNSCEAVFRHVQCTRSPPGSCLLLLSAPQPVPLPDATLYGFRPATMDA